MGCRGMDADRENNNISFRFSRIPAKKSCSVLWNRAKEKNDARQTTFQVSIDPQHPTSRRAMSSLPIPPTLSSRDIKLQTRKSLEKECEHQGALTTSRF
jgi:hypothetical protein